MRRLFAALLALAALAALVTTIAATIARPSSLDYARERAALDALAREQEQAEQLAPAQILAGQLLALAPVVAVYGLILFAGAWGSLALIRFLRERRADSRGLLPVPQGHLGDAGVAALAAYHAAALAAASRPNTPHSLTYSPHTTYAPHSAPRLDYRADAGGVALLPADEPTALAAPVPSFSQLLSAGRVGRGNPMVLGFDVATGAPVEGSWLDLYSCGLGGLSGSGKSWTAVYLASQAALFGTRIVLLDPHAEHAESLAARLSPLASRFVCAPAESPREMRAAVELVAAELKARKGGRRGEPLLFIADEYSALQRGELADPLAELVEALGQEGRKLGLYAMVAGQVWSASRAGGTEVRDSLASAYVHRCRPAQARMLTGMTAADLPGDLLELPAGTAYLLDTAGDFRKVTIPHMGAGDVRRVAGLLGDGQASMVDLGAFRATSTNVENTPRMEGPWKPYGSPVEGTPGAASTAAGRGAAGRAPLDAESARILAGFAAGRSIPELVRDLAGSTSGRRADEARARVEALLRQQLGPAA